VQNQKEKMDEKGGERIKKRGRQTKTNLEVEYRGRVGPPTKGPQWTFRVNELCVGRRRGTGEKKRLKKKRKKGESR